MQKSKTILLTLILLFSSPILQAANGYQLETLFDEYYQIEPVAFSITNTGDADIYLFNAAPWSVVDENNRVVFQPIAAQVWTRLAPGESREWQWDQRDDLGRNVVPGQYRILLDKRNVYVRQSDFSVAIPADVSFNINNLLGSRGYFTFDVAGERLRVYMTNPLSIRDAIENYYRLNTKSIPVGDVIDDRPGRSPYDGQWSWHLEPGSIVMAEFTIEVCDARPSYIEANLDQWLTTVGVYCPRGAAISALN